VAWQAGTSDAQAAATARLVAVSAPGKAAVGFYAASIVAAEACVAFVGSLPGIYVHAALVFVVLNHYLFAPKAAPSADLPRVLLALPLVSLLRILSLTMAVNDIPEIYRPAVAGAPLLVAAVFVLKLLAPTVPVGLIPGSRRSWFVQALVALVGIPLGLLGYAIARPDPLLDSSEWPKLIAAAAVLLIFSGLTEELVFRGLVQATLRNALGWVAVPLASVLFASVYFGASAGLIVFFAGTGVVFGAFYDRTRCLLGIIGAHALLSIGLILIWPLVL